MEAGAAFALRPVGILALDVARVEAGLIMAEVDYTSAWHALDAAARRTRPSSSVWAGSWTSTRTCPSWGGPPCATNTQAGGPPRRLVGLDLDWDGLERMHARHGLSPALSPQAWRDQIPVFGAGRQVGRATSGTWSPMLKKNLAMATVEATCAAPGTHLEMEWSVEGERGRIGATVTALPFFDPPRKRE